MISDAASAAAPRPADDDDAQEFEAEFHDGPPVAGVAILLSVFMAGMALGGWLVWVG